MIRRIFHKCARAHKAKGFSCVMSRTVVSRLRVESKLLGFGSKRIYRICALPKKGYRIASDESETW